MLYGTAAFYFFVGWYSDRIENVVQLVGLIKFLFISVVCIILSIYSVSLATTVVPTVAMKNTTRAEAGFRLKVTYRTSTDLLEH